MTKVHIERAYCDRSHSALADAVGVTQQTVSNWPKGGPIRPEHCSAIELFTAGALRAAIFAPTTGTRSGPEPSSTRHCPSTLRASGRRDVTIK